MRSDVKVGVICLFVLLLAVVGYFAWNGGGGTKGDRAGREGPGRVQTGLASDPGHGGVAGGTGGILAGPTATQPTETGTSFGPRTAFGAGIPPSMTAPAAATQPTLAGGAGLGGYSPGTTIISTATTYTPATSQPVGDLGLSGASTRPAVVTATMPATTMAATRPWYGGPRLSGGTPGLTGGVPGMPGFGTTTTAPATSEYVVKKGDSLWTVAHANHITIGALASANGLAADAQLKEKQKLKIPAAVTSLTATTHPATGPATTRAATSVVASVTVKAGDSLRKIAKTVYGDEAQWKKIYAANKTTIGADPNDLALGTKLTIP